MKNITLHKKLQSYAALAGAMASPAFVSGQIVYHDFDPDIEVMAGDSFDLDLNNDGIVDFTLHSFINAGAFTKAEVYVNSALDSNAIDASIGPLGYYYPKVLATSDLIDVNNSWIAPIPYATFVINYTSGNVYGNWSGTDNGYLAMRFLVGANLHYGWLRMDISVDGSKITMKDYGYNSNPGDGIKAGEAPVGIGNVSPPLAVSAFVYDNRQLMIHITQPLTNAVMSVYNILGQNMLQKDIASGNTQADLSQLSPGNYIITIKAKEGVFARKFGLH
ncbi:MAG: T9SS type A sorting domain-containing protein [Chitinophagales bacterium]